MGERKKGIGELMRVAAQHPLYKETLQWLLTPEATIKAKVACKGCPGVQAKDLISPAYDHVVRNFHRAYETLDADPKTAEQYGTSVLRTIVKSLYREVGGDRLRPLGDDVYDTGAVSNPQSHLHQRQYTYPEAAVSDRGPRLDPERIDEVRAAIECTAADPRARAAALTWATLAAHRSIDLEGIPQPAAGATQLQAFEWAGLWVAGWRDIFPDAKSDPPAQRTMRNRRQKAVRAVIAQAVAVVFGPEVTE